MRSPASSIRFPWLRPVPCSRRAMTTPAGFETKTNNDCEFSYDNSPCCKLQESAATLPQAAPLGGGLGAKASLIDGTSAPTENLQYIGEIVRPHAQVRSR